MASQKKKVTLYFNAAMLAETQKEALRQDRSVSWIIQAAWRIARDEVKRMPGALTPAGQANRAGAATTSTTSTPANGSVTQVEASTAAATPPGRVATRSM
jgi:uncharacterized small protein (TIGR04563 family)